MSHHDHHDTLTPDEAADRIWELADKIGIAILTTWSGDRQHGRPLAAHVARDEHAIYFLVDEDGGKNAEIAQYPQVSTSFVDKSSNSYVVVAGTAAISNDRQKIGEIWSDWAKAWWNDANDPSIRLLKITPESGEVWDGPNRLASLAKMAYAAATGGRPDMGDNASARL